MSYRDLQPITTPLAVSGIEASHVLEFDQGATLFTQQFIVDRTSYTAPAFSTTCPVYPTAFFAGDNNFNDRGDSIWEFRREWVTVPDGFEAREDYAFTFPGYASSVTGAPMTVSAITVASNDLVISCTNSSITAGDGVYYYIDYSYTLGLATVSGGYSAYKTAKSATASNVTIEDPWPFKSTISYSVGSSSKIMKAILGRNTPRTLIVPSRVVDEFLYTTSPETDLPIAQPFKPITTSTGEEATRLTLIGTIPDAASYSNLVRVGGELVAECKLQRWKGNIYRRTTRFVTAQ